MNNPIEMLRAIKNPKAFVNDYLSKNNNPIVKNLLEMANKGDQKGVENFASNFFRQQGMDFNEIMKMFK